MLSVYSLQVNTSFSTTLNQLILFGHNEKSSILLIAFIHALIFSFLLLRNGLNADKTHSKWLAAFIFLGALYISPFMLGYAGWYSVKSYREILFFVPCQQLLLLGPVFYFYVKSLLNSDLKLHQKDLLHFFPAILYLIYSLIVFIVDKLILDEFYFYADGKDMDLDLWYQIVGLVSMLFYLFLSLRHYLNYRKLSLEEVSYADEIAFTWIQHFIMAFGLILVLRVLFFILNPEWGEFGRKYWYYLCFSILLMYISISGYTHTIKTTLSLDTKFLGQIEPVQQELVVAPKEGTEEEWELDSWKHKITDLFEAEEVHKSPNLTLTDIAQRLDTNRNVISKVINQVFDLNFNDFVNEKRAQAVIEKLQKGEHTQHTLLSIALDCGFNSKTTFNRAFKKHTGTTPKQFIAQHQL
ncbi:MAG: helix-turn-helix domain-containing protein [Bacteroidota bacterium]